MTTPVENFMSHLMRHVTVKTLARFGRFRIAFRLIVEGVMNFIFRQQSYSQDSSLSYASIFQIPTI